MFLFLKLLIKNNNQAIKIILACFILFLVPKSIAQDPALHSYIVKKILPQTYRIKKFQWHKEKYWLKKTTINKDFWLYRFGRNLGANIIPIVFLKPTPYGDKNPLELEKERLLECEKRNVNCPRLIDSGTDWFVTTDAGITAEQYLKGLPLSQRIEFTLKLIRTILHNQDKGFFHGRYYLRDMLVSPTGKIFVFDIEENPLDIMDVTNAKAREIFHFIVSISTILNDNEMMQLGFWLNKHLDKETKKSLLIFEHYKKTLKFLVFFKNYIGRDPARFLHAALFIISYLDIQK
ncbi:MAG: hypothetical protein J0H12_06140 [Candidatus Paracaedimonas acanthamoebae]|uniref:Uncharacterized protein n=1 Tax=Candidatus Paracaedimonas acanthamoebae TaxID=244581 RepID=A0A8J7TUS8_9PROT|nr:hypothetical protein [Candidatus Paracaedimonas acanthamoebae]